MPLTRITVTGTHTSLGQTVNRKTFVYVDAVEVDGTGVASQIPVVMDLDGNKVLQGVDKVQVDAEGDWSLSLPATDDANLDPSGYAYRIRVVENGREVYSDLFTLPAATASPVSITDLVTAAGPIAASYVSLAAHLADTVDAHAASAISYAGSTNLAATNVEAALDELDSEKQSAAGLDAAVAAFVGDTGTDTGAALSNAIVGKQQGLDFSPLVATETTVTAVRPIGSIGDGYAYGTHNSTGGLYRSTNGTTWEQVPNLTGNPITIHDAGDGEVLVNRSGTLQKSSGWATDPLAATFSTVATATSGAAFIQSGIDVYDNIVLLAEYAVPRTPSKLVRVSTDHGATFSESLNLDTLHPSNIADTHWHAVAIDPWHDGANPRLYASHGDGPRGVYYSDDLGENWTLLRNDWQPMPLVATEAGLVTATDANDPDGVWLIPREDTSTRTQLYRIPAPYWSNSLLGFGLKAHRDPATGIVYITFRVDTLASIGKNLRGMIFATDGRRAALVYETELAATTGQNVTFDSPATLPDGTLLVSYLVPGSATDRRLIRASPGNRGDIPLHERNAGNIYSGTALDRASVVIGPETTATGRSVVIGTGITQTSTDASTDFRQVLIGAGVNGGNQAVGIGQDVTADRQRAVAVGMTASVTGSDGVALGANTVAHTSGVAIGKAATTGTGINCVAIGMNATITGNNGTTIGFGSTSAALGVALGYMANAHSGSVALGASVATSAGSQVAIGQKHIEGTELAADPSAPAVNGFRLYAKDNGSGKTALFVRFNTGAVQQVAIEP